MKLLICTQKVDKRDPVLGFFHGWIEEFAKQCEMVTVISLGIGEYNFPSNVKVLSLGKGTGGGRFRYIWSFYKYVFFQRKGYDVVFVHMNPVYIILGGVFWKIWRKKIALWYAHKKGSKLASLSLFFIDKVFSVSKESFYKSHLKKFFPTGHGINVTNFQCENRVLSEKVKVVSINRVTPVKEYEILIDAVNILVNERGIYNIRVEIIGGACVKSDEEYLVKLKKMVEAFRLQNFVFFVGEVPNSELLPYLCSSDIFINMQKIGGAGKSTLEAMSCGLLTIVCTPVFVPFLEGAENLFCFDGMADDLAKKIQLCIDLPEGEKIKYRKKMREIVVKEHNLENLVKRILEKYTN